MELINDIKLLISSVQKTNDFEKNISNINNFFTLNKKNIYNYNKEDISYFKLLRLIDTLHTYSDYIYLPEEQKSDFLSYWNTFSEDVINESNEQSQFNYESYLNNFEFNFSWKYQFNRILLNIF